MQLVATPDTDLLLILTPPFDQEHIIPFVSHMSVESVEFVSVVECFVHTNIYTLSLLKRNGVGSERTFIFLHSQGISLHSQGIRCCHDKKGLITQH